MISNNIRNLEMLDELLHQMSSVNVIIIGDTICDEFVFCKESMGSQMDSRIGIRVRDVTHLGGVVSVAKSLSSFARVRLITDRAGNDYKLLEDERLKIAPLSFGQPQIKRRYVSEQGTRLFYELVPATETCSNSQFDEFVIDCLSIESPLLLVYDYGASSLVKSIQNTFPEMYKQFPIFFNSQLNTFRPLPPPKEQLEKSTVWFMNENEARVRTGAKTGDFDFCPRRFRAAHITDNVVVTFGPEGLAWHSGTERISVASPAVEANRFAIGMGDITMAISALVYFVTHDLRLAIKLGACAGAKKAEIFGHERNIYPTDIETVWARHYLS